MIARIIGKVIEITPPEVIIEAGALSYAVATNALISKVGEIIALHTCLIIKDDCHELYGFVTKEEKHLFKILIGVSGVGPKTALHMLTLYTLPDLVRNIKSGNAKAVALVPGIGKKTSEKVVIDLKDKLDTFTTSESAASTDLVEALLSLGYKEHQIRPVAGGIDSKIPIEKQITQALQLMQK